MANLVNFRTYMANIADQNGLPPVCLCDSTDLSMALSKLITVDNRGADETNSQVTQRYIDEICASLCKPENKEIADKLNAVVACFKEKLATSIKSVKDIKENAKQLAADMEKVAQDYLAGDPFVSKHLKLTTLSTDYPEWKWEGPLMIGSPAIIANTVNSKFAASEESVSDAFDYKNLTNSILYIRKEHPIKAVAEMDSTTLDEFVNSISEVLPDMSVETIKEVVDVLLGVKLINSIYSQLEGIAHLDPALIFKTVQEFDGYIQKFYPIADAIASGTVAVPETSKDVIVSNATSLKVLCVHFAYFELMERNTVMRQSILLQGGLINSDEKSAYEEAGGTQQMIAHYIRFMYNDDVSKIPVRGVPSKVIIESAAHNEKVVTESMTNIANRIAVVTTKAHVFAFKQVATQYLNHLIERTAGEGTNKVDNVIMFTRLSDAALTPVANSILQYDIGFVDACMTLIINAEFRDTFVEKLANELGAKYLATVNAAGGEEVKDLDFRVAEMDVIARMVSGFVVEHLVGVCECKDMTVKTPVVPAQED